MQQSEPVQKRPTHRIRGSFATLLLAVGSILILGGAWLLTLGGSPYYLIAGLLAALSGWETFRGRWRRAAWMYCFLMAGTLVWSLWEVGLNGWGLAPRLLSPAVIGLPFLIAALWRGTLQDRTVAITVGTIAVALIAAVSARSAYQPVARINRSLTAAIPEGSGEWPVFGRTNGGGWYSPLTQINVSNAAKLHVAWTTLIGPIPLKPLAGSEDVPLKIGDSLYTCGPFGDMAALDPHSGAVRWKFDAKSNSTGVSNAKCRGVAYYDVPNASGLCASRVYSATVEGRLLAVDSRTGRACPNFGSNGVVSLLEGLSQRSPGYYGVTSAPLLADGKLVVGGRVADGQYVGEPSGVIRAYDAVTGKLAWAWDVGNPANSQGPVPGTSYTPGTPNAWGPMSADEAIGLIYVPMANSTPDRWAGHRSPESNKYGSGVAALEMSTGKLRWFFQTVHHDLWDYDVASQPILYDIPTPAGPLPALVQPTKQGQVFVLNRRTGKPIFPVRELAVPQYGAVEKLSPTQPFSTGFANMSGDRMTEKSMWGLTALDQMVCRIKFRQSRYEGMFTPPGLQRTLQYPGSAGGMNWASGAIDPVRGLAFFSTNYMISDVRLMPRQEAMRKKVKPSPAGDLGGPVAQEGAPYAADVSMFFSPIFALCKEPPYGMINAVDMTTGKLVWSRALGSARDLGPAIIPSHLPFTLGTPLLGGPMTTAGGLVFVAGSVDRTLRVFDSETGSLLFEHDLPGFHNGTVPMSYRDRTGRQIVAITSTVKKSDGVYVAINAFAIR